MEGYLKNLFDDLDKSQSSDVRIIDDNFNSSFGSLRDHRRRRGERRRAHSLNTSLVFNQIPSSDDEDFSGSSLSTLKLNDSVGSSESFTPKSTKNGNEIQLSARMRRHRQNRWSATETPRPTVRQSLSPGILRGRKRYSAGTKTEFLRNSLELANQGNVSRGQRKEISIVRDYNDNRESISCSRDSSANRAMSDRISPAALSSGLFNDSIGYVPLSSAEVINKAIAITSENPTDNSIDKSKTRGRRSSRRGRPLKVSSVDSPHAPPAIPKRKGSMDNICDDPEKDANLSPKLQNAKLQISTIVLKELPYQKGRKYV